MFRVTLRALLLTVLISSSALARASVTAVGGRGSALSSGVAPLLMTIDWNQFYALLISYGYTPAQAQEIVMQGQKNAGDPVVGCTSSPENPTALLACLGVVGLTGGFVLRRRLQRQSRRQSRISVASTA